MRRETVLSFIPAARASNCRDPALIDHDHRLLLLLLAVLAVIENTLELLELDR